MTLLTTMQIDIIKKELIMKREGFIIPDFIQKDIDALQAGLNDPNCFHVDCLVEELAATINSAATNGDISDDDADWLFRVYLHRYD